MGVIMFFNKKNSTLNKILNMYLSSFNNWERKRFNDGSIDEVVFENDNIKIIFSEDLREHIVNLFVIHPQKIIAKVYYREIFLGNELIGVEELKNSILELENKNNVEKKEVEIYIEFLKNNKII